MDNLLYEWHQYSYDKLMTELAVALQLSPDDMKRTCHLVVVGIDIGLLDYGVQDLGRITLFVDLGSFPESKSTAVCCGRSTSWTCTLASLMSKRSKFESLSAPCLVASNT